MIHEFDPVIFPFKLWIEIGKETFTTDFSLFQDDGILVVSTNNRARTYCVYRNSDQKVGILIYSPKKKYMDINTIAHEARHAGDMLFELIGDEPQHSEPAAYFTGWVAECIDKVRRYKKSG